MALILCKSGSNVGWHDEDTTSGYAMLAKNADTVGWKTSQATGVYLFKDGANVGWRQKTFATWTPVQITLQGSAVSAYGATTASSQTAGATSSNTDWNSVAIVNSSVSGPYAGSGTYVLGASATFNPAGTGYIQDSATSATAARSLGTVFNAGSSAQYYDAPDGTLQNYTLQGSAYGTGYASNGSVSINRVSAVQLRTLAIGVRTVSLGTMSGNSSQSSGYKSYTRQVATTYSTANVTVLGASVGTKYQAGSTITVYVRS